MSSLSLKIEDIHKRDFVVQLFDRQNLITPSKFDVTTVRLRRRYRPDLNGQKTSRLMFKVTAAFVSASVSAIIKKTSYRLSIFDSLTNQTSVGKKFLKKII